MTARARVVITGLGAVSALGSGIPQFWENLCLGKSGIRLLERPGPEWPAAEPQQPYRFLGAQASEPESPAALGSLSPALLDHFSRFALYAAAEAIDDAGSGFIARHKSRVATIMGAAVGGDAARNSATWRCYVKGRKPHPNTVVKAMANAAASAISLVHGLQGPTFSVNSACASAGHAIAQAFQMIRHGMVDVALTGGSESLPSYSLWRSWQSMRVLSNDGCRPFSADRNGMVLGEGAGVLVLENRESALRRGVLIYGEIIGVGLNADAGDMVKPNFSRMKQAMETALNDGNLNPTDVDFINAHGTGTKLNDQAEARALSQLFGDRIGNLPVCANKAQLGHALGAAGALELIATSLSLRHGRVPPVPAQTLDPQCAINLVVEKPHIGELRTALCNSFALGGLNAVIAVRRHEQNPTGRKS